MKKITLFLGVIGLAAGCASAAIVTIDPFDQPPSTGAQNVCVSTSVSTPCTAPASSGVSGIDTIFGTRWMSITQTSGSDPDTGDVNQGSPNALSFNNSSGSSSNLLVRWDGSATGSLIFTATPVDVTSGFSNSAFILQVLGSDHPVPGGISITVYTDATHHSTATQNDPLIFPDLGDPPQDLLFLFSSFTPDSGASAVDFTHITAIDLNLKGSKALDMTLDFLQAGPSPEPGTWVMMGAGLLGLGAVARRRKKA